MDDRWNFIGGEEAALEKQQQLLAQGGRHIASQYPDLVPANRPDMNLAGESVDDDPTADPDVAFRDLSTAEHSSATPQDAPTTPSGTSDTPSPKVVRRRPGAYERRTDGEPGVYQELPSFPIFDDPIPEDATLEELCVQYPNHLRGSYLDAFIQYRWTATDMYTHLSDKAQQEFVICGVSRAKAWGNRANFLSKRLNNRLTELSAEEVTALCTGDKIRGCLIDGSEYYGACKLQGKFHNPTAPPIRTFLQRQNQARRGRASNAGAATKTITLNGKEYRLWGSADEFDTFKRSMAQHWNRQRGYAGLIISADAVHAISKNSQRNQLILRIANWPADSATETFFSFDNVEDCPKFLCSINDMVAAGVINILDSSADTNIGHQLRLARQSTVEYVLSFQVARLQKLSDLVATLPAGSVSSGVVEQVLSWDGGAVHGLAPSTGAPLDSFGGNMSTFQAGANHFAGNGTVPHALNPPAPNIFDVYFKAMEDEGMTLQEGSLQPRPIARKRAREESTQQVRPFKRAREGPAVQTAPMKRAQIVQPATVPRGQGLLGRANHAADARMPTATADPNADPFAVFEDTFNLENAAASGLSVIPVDPRMSNWPVDGIPDADDFLATTPADSNLVWPDVDMAGMMQQTGLGPALPDLAQQLQPAQPSFATDVSFSDAPPMADMWGELNVDGMLGGVDEFSNENMDLTTDVEVAQGMASSTAAAATDAALLWGLPEMQDNDKPWLREAIYGPGQ
ncbi:hypothetical protein H2200_010203 [Cladophialophora chaetospira]|uniref:Uncharacterized protein n=1 Tax=Cladophialophora chaetospira TaxID=386627 RepID=A0AA38X2D0_9EURO|nr:hypothetical protein H2200_010203 [Cladophialophora chaetospira]